MSLRDELVKVETDRMQALDAGDIATFERLAAEQTRLYEAIEQEARYATTPRRSSGRRAPAAVITGSWRGK